MNMTAGGNYFFWGGEGEGQLGDNFPGDNIDLYWKPHNFKKAIQ